jgi:drug/metabolite transporter (DMT)-like permease
MCVPLVCQSIGVGISQLMLTSPSFQSPQMMDMAKASVINLTSPLWTAVLAACVEKGTWSRYDTFGSITSLAGIVLMLQPPPLFRSDGTSFKDDLPGIVAALIAALSMAGVSPPGREE